MRRTLRTVGLGLIAVSVGLAALIGWQVVGTREVAARAASDTLRELDEDWANTFVPTQRGSASPSPSASGSRTAGPPAEPTASPTAAMRPPLEGVAFGRVYVPRLRDRAWGLPLVEGIQPEHIDKGFARFPHSAMPGEEGNFAVAAHRATRLEPLAEVDRLRTGDRVFVRTKTAWFEYRLTHDRIVNPTDTWVVDPVPGQPRARPDRSLITLVTCEPRWGSTHRWIWWGELVSEHPASASIKDLTHGRASTIS